MRNLLIILSIFLLAFPLTGQQQTGNIYGKVIDGEGNPLPGVAVTLFGTKIAPISAISSAGGAFRFFSLYPSKGYAIKLEIQGFKTKVEEGIIVAVGVNTELVLTMAMGTIQEEVTVTALSPVVDTRRTSITQTVDYDTLQALPTARDPWVILQTVPAIQVSMENVGGSTSGGQSAFATKGGSISNTTWTLDGVNITDPEIMGYSSSYYDYDIFEEMNVTIGGADVEAQSGGIALNMVTRRGGNKISFGGRYFYAEETFQAQPASNWHSPNDPFPENPTDWDELKLIFGFDAGYNRIRDIKDFGFNVGGPLYKDKAWLWGSYGVQQIQTSYITGAEWDRFLNFYALKFNMQIIPENRFEFFVHGADKKQYGVGSSTAFPSGMNTHSLYHFGNPILKIQDEHMFGDNLFVSAKFGYSNNAFGGWPANDEDLEEVPWYNIANRVTERSFYWYSQKRPNKQITVHAIYIDDDLFGAAHEIKAGVEYIDRRDEVAGSFSNGNMFINYNYNYPTVDWNGDGIRDVMIADFGIDLRLLLFRRGTIKDGPDGSYQWSGFFSDTISFGRFNLKLGIRYDKQIPWSEGGIFNSIFAEESEETGFENFYEIHQRYLGPGVDQAILDLFPGAAIPEVRTNETIAWNFWSPRLGMTWDVTGDGRTIAKLSGAIYGDRMGSSESVLWKKMGGGGILQFWWYDKNDDEAVTLEELYWADYTSSRSAYPAFDADGIFVGNWDRAKNYMWWGFDYTDPTATTDSRYAVDPDLSADRTYEILLTLEREIFADFSIAIDITWRKYNNFRVDRRYATEPGGRLLERSDYVQAPNQVPTSYTDPATGKAIDLGDAADRIWYVWSEEIRNIYELYATNTPLDYYNQYWGLDIRVNKRLSNKWMLSGSFTWQDQRNFWGETYPLDPTNQWAEDGKTYAYSYGGYGLEAQPLFSRWMIKAQGLYQLPYDFNFSFTFNAREGQIIPHRIGIADFTAPNPASQSVMMYTEEYGKTRLPTFWNLNLRLEKALRLGDTGRVYLIVDAFNILNNNILIRQLEVNPGTIYLDTGTFSENVRSNEPNEVLNPRVIRFGVRFQF